ncbi:hypothetical protein KF728_21490 [Candidatus Obscuribacterales bacterium]|nr:hypothetical protein [Candidatus Obscuribacterales bacterium]MBX3152746.1 hypothetical protein [Candidatus Obscuribacterales bacterium]
MGAVFVSLGILGRIVEACSDWFWRSLVAGIL